MFAASLSAACIHWRVDEWTLAHLLREGHVTAAVATLAYLPETESITQVRAMTTEVSFVWVYACGWVCIGCRWSSS